MRPKNPLTVRDLEKLKQRVKTSTRVIPHSNRSLAEVTGFSHATIGHLLTGKKQRVTPELAERLSEALGASVDELFAPIVSPFGDADNRSLVALAAPAESMRAGTGATAPENDAP